MQAVPCGLLRVTAPLSLSMLGPIATEFLRRYPDLQLELVCTDRRVDLVEESFDLAIRAGSLDDSSLISRSLGTIERVLVAATSYLAHRGTPQTPADLDGHTCIAFGAGSAPSLWTLYAGDRKTEVRITARFLVNDFPMMRDAARTGIGIAWLPRFVCHDDLRTGRLQQVLPDWCSVGTPLQAVYPTTRHLSPKVLAFVELLRQQLSLGEPAAPA